MEAVVVDISLFRAYPTILRVADCAQREGWVTGVVRVAAVVRNGPHHSAAELGHAVQALFPELRLVVLVDLQIAGAAPSSAEVAQIAIDACEIRASAHVILSQGHIMHHLSDGCRSLRRQDHLTLLAALENLVVSLHHLFPVLCVHESHEHGLEFVRDAIKILLVLGVQIDQSLQLQHEHRHSVIAMTFG